MNYKKTAITLAGIAALFSSVASASTAFQIEVEFKNKKTRLGYATKVNDSTFVTDAELIGSAATVYLVNSQVSPPSKVLAEIKNVDEKSRVAIISAGGLPGDAVTFSYSSLDIGRTLSQTVDGKTQKGMVIKFDLEEDIFKEQNVYVHQMLYLKDQWAAPIFNNCNELAGINLAKTGVFSGMQAPENFAYAMDSQSLAKYLQTQKVEINVAKERCLSEAEQAQKKADEAAKEQAELKKKLEEEAKATKALEERLKKEAEEKAKAKEIADKAKQDADKAKQDADKANKEKEEKDKAAKEEIEKKKKEADKKIEDLKKKTQQEQEEAAKKQQMIYAGIGGVIVILIIITIVILSKRKRMLREKEAQINAKSQQANSLAEQKQELQQELEQFQRTFTDILLEGVDSTGSAVKIKIDGNMLAQRGTQSLGRDSNNVDYLLADEEVSRQHLRLSIEGEQLAIEDLGSHNGTVLNGQALNPGQISVVPDGSEIILSTAKLRVQYLQ